VYRPRERARTLNMFIGGATQLECALAHRSEPFHRADWLKNTVPNAMPVSRRPPKTKPDRCAN
jgi:hypothetical protein